jgi:glutathione S-transferase
MSQPTTKKPRTQPQYELLYHPSIPGRGEFIRLALEASGTPYTDIANEDSKNGYSTVQKVTMNSSSLESEAGNPPTFAPPALRIPGAGKDGGSLVISQTSNILLYLGEKLELSGSSEAEKYWINQLALTALDLNNEVHDTHHPIAVMKYYEDQKEESLKKSTDVRENRIPKFLSYFQRTLKGNGNGKYMVGEKLSYADLVVWQVLDGLQFAFPKEMEFRKQEHAELFEFHEGLKKEKGIKEYLGSERRLPYSEGVFRYYPELDRQ